MDYILYFDYSAIGIMILTLYYLLTRKDMTKTENKALAVILVLGFVAAIADITAIVVQNDIPRFGTMWRYFWNYLYLYVHTQIPLAFAYYIVLMLGIRKQMKLSYKLVFAVPSIIVLFILLLNPVFGWYFYYNEQEIYSYGPMSTVLFLCPLIQVAAALYLLVKFRKNLQRRMFIALIVFFLFTIAALVFQTFHREYLVELYAQSLALLGIMFAIENKDEIRSLMETMTALEAEKRRADDANRSKSQFLANMSHEIRTPVNAIMGMDDMILRDSLHKEDAVPKEEARIRELFDNINLYAGNIQSAGNNLLSIINNILDFSRIEAGKMEINATVYHLGSLLNDVSNMVAVRAKAKDLAFQVDVDEKLPDVLYGDEVRIRQIMTNLLNNAVKYTDKGEIVLRMRGDRIADAKEGRRAQMNLVVTVEDTGTGIREEDMERLFGTFERFDLTRNNQVEGSGLGLAITKNLLALMDGSIHVDSTYGKGSVFTVTIPQEVEEELPIGDFRARFEESIKEMKSYHESFRAPDAQILVVDDTAMNLTVIKGLLKRTQMQIETVTSGMDALRLTADVPFDIILMDQRMPVMDGIQTLRHIREQEGVNTETPVVCLTADAIEGAKERYLAEGFSDYLAKPVDGAALEAMMRRLLPGEKVVVIRQESEETGKQEGGRFLAPPGMTEGVGGETSAAPEPVEGPGGETSAAPEPVEGSGGETSAAPEPVEGPGGEKDVPDHMSREVALRKIRELTPKLLSDYRALGLLLGDFREGPSGVRQKGELPLMEKEAIEEVYEAVSEFAGMYDLDSIDHVLSQAENYRIPDEEAERFEELRLCVRDSDWEGLKRVLEGR